MKVTTVYAYGLNVWAQLAVLLSIASNIMVAGLFYQNILSHYIPLWLFVSLAAVVLTVAVVFIVKWGIRAYYRVMSEQLEKGKNGE